MILALFARKLDYAMEQRLVMLITGRCFVWAAMRTIRSFKFTFLFHKLYFFLSLIKVRDTIYMPFRPS